MQKTSETEQFLSKILLEFDEHRKRSLYSSLCAAARKMKVDGELPQSAYDAAASFLRCELLKLARDGVEMVDSMFEMIEAMPEQDELKEKAKNAKMPYMFFAALAKAAIDDVDADYLVETVVEAGKARLEKSKAEKKAAQA